MNYNKIILFILFSIVIASLISCSSSSEIITQSSKNLHKGEKAFTTAASFNPSVTTDFYELDSTDNKYYRNFINYTFPTNLIASGQMNYGITDYYNFGIGMDVSLLGITGFINNKFELTFSKDTNEHKFFRISFYNKTSNTIGIDLARLMSTRTPFEKVSHLETGNYFVAGFFFDDFEIIIAPHVDINYLISWPVADKFSNNYFSTYYGPLENTNLLFINYGLNIGLHYDEDFYLEIGAQYLDTDNLRLERYADQIWQIMIGFGYRSNFFK